MQRLLIADDDQYIRTIVKTYAAANEFACSEAADGQEALELIAAQDFDIIILDVMMPGKDGFETLAEIRKASDTPVILLTARKEEYDKLFGFDLGADDYMSKPFSPKELMARVRAVLKRSGGRPRGPVVFGGLEIREDSRTVTLGEESISLTPKEFDLLLYLAKNRDIVMDRDKLLKNVWGYDYFGDARTVDTHVKSLREKLGDCRDLVSTVWGVGYKFEFEEEPESDSGAEK